MSAIPPRKSRAEEMMEEAMAEADASASPSIPTAAQTYGTPKAPGIVPRRGQIPPDAIVKRGDGALGYKNFVIETVGVIIPDDTEYADWQDLGEIIKNMASATQWAAGDWAAYANDKWGISYDLIAQEFNYEVETLYTYASVCRSIPTSMRHRGLRFGHHRKVVSIKEVEMRAQWLEWAAQEGWSEKELAARISAWRKGDHEPAALPSPLASSPYHQTWKRVWKALEKNRPVSREDIQFLRDWLDELENSTNSTG